jgi:hypothetical protein
LAGCVNDRVAGAEDAAAARLAPGAAGAPEGRAVADPAGREPPLSEGRFTLAELGEPAGREPPLSEGRLTLADGWVRTGALVGPELGRDGWLAAGRDTGVDRAALA